MIMKNVLLMKLKESAMSVIPIIAFIVLLSFTPLYSLSFYQISAFIFVSIFAIIGIALFDLGADISMTPIGRYIGEGLTAKRKFGLLILVSFIIGVLITVSEPDLGVLANQLSSLINKYFLIITVGLGVGFLLVITILKIFFKKSLSLLLMFFYLLTFAITILAVDANGFAFIPLAYDSGGVTTGPITVPFILALGIGISNALNSKDSKDNSFGLIALCSGGAIFAVLILSIFMKGNLSYDVSDYGISNSLYLDFFKNIPQICKQVGISLGLIVFIFLFCEITILKIDVKKLKNLAIGLILTFTGLVLFLTAVETMFIDVGFEIGIQMAESSNNATLIIFGFVLGALVVLAEPAIQVLVRQVEEITNGMVTKKAVLIGMAAGVGLAVALSIIRIIFNLNLMYFIVPSYIISFALSFFVPPVYTAIAFDSGGVATGSLSSSFVLPLMIGLCSVLQGTNAVLQSAFGILAMVGVIPLITVQLLGFGTIIRRNREKKIIMKNILSSDDKQIINFD